MNSVIDPGILFISNSEWENECKRDAFLIHLLDNLKNINRYDITRIYWTDRLESLLWESPQLPPWRIDRDWKLQMVPIIYKLFRRRMLSRCIEKFHPCKVAPAMNCDYGKEDVHNCFLQLMHTIVCNNEDIFLCLGLKNKLPVRSKYIFFCSCHSNKLEPVLINAPYDWLKYINVESDYWPSNTEDFDKFNTALEITRKKIFPEKKPIHKYKFSSRFINDIVQTFDHRSKILENIVKKLILSRQEASKDADLRDEYIENKKEFRFRVMQRPASTRIHYKYLKDNEIEFLRYYEEGRHDNGL